MKKTDKKSEKSEKNALLLSKSCLQFEQLLVLRKDVFSPKRNLLKKPPKRRLFRFIGFWFHRAIHLTVCKHPLEWYNPCIFAKARSVFALRAHFTVRKNE